MTSKIAMDLIRQLELQKIQAQINFAKASDCLSRCETSDRRSLLEKAKLNEEICGLNQIIQDYLEV